MKKYQHLKIAAYQDVMFLFSFISFTGASTFVPYGEGTQETNRVTTGFRVAQKVFCIIVSFLLAAMSAFEIVQFAIVIWDMDNFGEVIPNVIWITSFPLALMAQAFYTLKRTVLLEFFQRWQHIQFEYAEEHEKVIERQTRPRMYYIYLLAVCISVAMVIVVILDFPILPFLPSTYKPVAEFGVFNNSLLSTCILFAVTLFYAWNLSAASDLVPSMIYFHLALALDKTVSLLRDPTPRPESLNENTADSDTKDTSFSIHPSHVDKVSFEGPRKKWRQSWLYYESIRCLIHEINARFGSMLVLNHGAMFFVAASNLFSILRWYRGLSWLLLLANGLNAAATILRLTTTILMCSKLSAASDRLQSHLGRFLATNWFELTDPERQFFASFLTRVQDRGVIASPLGLYLIQPSLLLALLSLLVTYMMVLLQTNTTAVNFASYGNFTGLITGTRFYTVA